MATSHKLIFPDTPSLVAALSSEFARLLTDFVRQHPTRQFHLAISGGRTPKALFEVWAKDFRHLPWHQVAIWWVDERGVPPTDAQSNYKMAFEAVIGPLGIAEENVYRMEGELPAAEAAERYEALIFSRIGHQPVFNLVMLGMGDDGHTASLFPHEPHLLPSSQWVMAATHPGGQPRITLTLRTLAQAEAVWWMVTGADKAEKVKAVWSDPASDLPAAQVHRRTPGSVWWLDEAAAGA